MTRAELKKLIHSYMAPVFKDAQFIRRGRSLTYYRITDNVLSFVHFYTKSSGYVCGIYVQPLYIRLEMLSLNLGRQLWDIDNSRHIDYRLTLEMGEDAILESLESHALFLRKTGFAWFDEVGSPRGIVKHITSIISKESRLFFTPPEWRYEAKAYSELYLGKQKTALRYFKKFVSELYRAGAVISPEDPLVKKVDALMEKIRKEPDAAEKELQENIQVMRRFLKLDP